ncbi:MAG: ABC transporter permease [Acholeplasmataceae bacterium]|nr:ABC transporter permease [Acholeplasmataceae bacterium]
MSKIRFKRKYLAIPYFLFLVLFVLVPLMLIIYYALSNEDGTVSLDNLVKFFSNKNKIGLLAISFLIGALNTALCLLIGYPVAMILAKSTKGQNKISIMVLLFIMPMWINFVLRTAATRDLLYWVGLDGGNHPYIATMIGMVYNYLPFTILPLYTTMIKMDKSLIDASYDLGANPVQTFFKTQIPLTMPGIISGAMMVFMPTMSSFVISDVMGERKIQLIGNTIQFNFDQMRWHEGSFIAFIMLVIIGISMLLTRNVKKEENARGGLW